MPLEALQILWYIVVGLAVTFYVVLDGFDLGVGALQLFAGDDKSRRIFLNSIGPFWDGNEVWLIIIAGALFVGFPDVYAVIFSGFYILMMVLLFGIICRAVAIEFRSKEKSLMWRYFWDFVFWLGSLVITFAAGILLGNLLMGVPVNENRELYYSFGSLFTAYPICIGIFSIFLFVMHGNQFLLMKTEGAIQERLYKFSYVTIPLFYGWFITMTIWTWVELPYMIDRFKQFWLFWLAPLALVIAMLLIAFFTKVRKHGLGFLCSMVSICLLFLLFAIGMFPKLVISTISPGYSLDLYNSSSAYTTLTVALIIACIGIPLVLGYGLLLYYVFRGKTKLHDHSY